MDTRAPHIALQHLGIFQSVTNQRIGRCFRRLQFGNVFNGICQIKFLIGYLVWHQLCQAVSLSQRKFLHTCHILDGHFGCHRAVSDDMGHFLLPIFFRHPTQHLASPVIIKVHINIRQGNTVWIQKTLEQQVILYRVYLRNA